MRRLARLAVFAAMVAAPLVFLQYFLPFNDVVRIVGTEVVRSDDQPAVDGGPVTEDVRYIHAVTADGEARVYRNEDTGWGWPFYFKFASADLAAEAEQAATAQSPVWHVVSRYGWRVPIISTFPNAIAIRPVPGPDAPAWPWVSLGLLAIAAFVLVRLWRRVDRMLAPAETTGTAAATGTADGGEAARASETRPPVASAPR